MGIDVANVVKKVAWHGVLVVLAIAVAALARALALRPDPKTEQSLNAPGVVALAMHTARRERSDDETPSKAPLVAAAEAFALCLNPPARPKERKPSPCAEMQSGVNLATADCRRGRTDPA